MYKAKLDRKKKSKNGPTKLTEILPVMGVSEKFGLSKASYCLYCLYYLQGEGAETFLNHY